MAFHFLVHFEPQAGKEHEFRQELLRVVPQTQAEPDCLLIRALESLSAPPRFAIYSEWTDEAAFERHAELPHTVAFIAAAEKLLTHPVKGFRARQIAGTPMREDAERA